MISCSTNNRVGTPTCEAGERRISRSIWESVPFLHRPRSTRDSTSGGHPGTEFARQPVHTPLLALRESVRRQPSRLIAGAQRQGGLVMILTRRLLPIVLCCAGFAVLLVGCAVSRAVGADATIPSAAQYAAIADDVCTGMPAKERALGLLAYREDIARVAPLFDDGPLGKVEYSDRGAVIRLRATPGMSVPWLERVNRCHAALVASGRLVGKESREDPFLVPGATLWAAEVYGGYYDLSVRSADDASAVEILRRSRALLSEPARRSTASLDSP